MILDLKNIHIGKLIEKRVQEKKIETGRICNFFKADEVSVTKMYDEKDLSSRDLLLWSKLLGYDFFRLYSQHLLLYSPADALQGGRSKRLPVFRKNIYTKELISFILEQINQNIMTPREVMEEYNIPKTTLYKWLQKYNISES